MGLAQISDLSPLSIYADHRPMSLTTTPQRIVNFCRLSK